jgi:RNA polymerase sigma-70 factor, ECF subfamily
VIPFKIQNLLNMEINKIHNQFHKLLHNYIVVRVNNKDDAADILQDVFIKISSNLNSLTEDEKLRSWIFTITRNAIIDYYRKNANTKKTDITDKITDELPEEDDVDVTKGLDKCLKGFIQKLPEEYRAIIIDSELKGIKQKELAEKYDLAYPSLRSRVQRGRARLKEMILNCCKIELDSRGNILNATSKKNCSDCD